MKMIWRIFFYIVSVFVLLPIMIGIFFQNEISILNDKKIKIERYLPYLLYETIPKEMHMETLKAQAVLLRTNLLKEIQNNPEDLYKWDAEYTFSMKEIKEEDRLYFKRFERACTETMGEVVLYDSELCKCPYYYCSNGITRDAFTYFEDTRYPYLISVPSQRDKESEHYTIYHYFSIEEFVHKMNQLCENTFDGNIEIYEYDSAGYVTWIKIGNQIIGGETFRNVLGLSSCCFSIEEVEDGIRIECKGLGHGFGFSQYGANAMAQGQEDYRGLIQYYFHNITIENVYTFS